MATNQEIRIAAGNQGEKKHSICTRRDLVWRTGKEHDVPVEILLKGLDDVLDIPSIEQTPADKNVGDGGLLQSLYELEPFPADRKVIGVEQGGEALAAVCARCDQGIQPTHEGKIRRKASIKTSSLSMPCPLGMR